MHDDTESGGQIQTDTTDADDVDQTPAPSPITRLPWTSSPTDRPLDTDLAWQQPAMGRQDDIFAISTGPTPEEIPGFPLPPTDELFGPVHAQPSRIPAPPARVATRAQTQQTTRAAQLGTTQTPLPPRAPGQPSAAPRSGLRPLPPSASQLQTQALHGTQVYGQTTGPTAGRPHFAAAPHGSNGPTDQLITGYLDPLLAQFPEPHTIHETGINQGLISDLVLKAMYFTSYMSGQDLSTMIRLPFYGVLDQVVNLLKREQLCEVSGTSGLGEAGYQYLLTVKGMERAHQVLARSSYIGPAPVPLARYIDAIRMQTARRPAVNRQTVENCLRGMVMGEELMNQVGAAVNAGRSLFLFGAPGNGKTLLAERISTMFGGHIAIPYALEADGQIVQLFDPNSHHPVVPAGTSPLDSLKAELSDRRWLRVYRPVVIVGGELTMASLDLIYNESAGFYEAPFQLKANGGLFLIDDFGRQQVSPQALLNRWVVPLEKNIDFLTLKTGKKLQVPFELFLVLSTNLSPEALIDDAFLRRIQNKLAVPDPTPQQFLEIFLGQCQMTGVPFDQNGFSYLVTKHYRDTNRPFRASQPRDLLRQLIGIARYRNVPPEMTPQLLDAACATYFVNTRPRAGT